MRDSVMALARPFHGRDEPADTVAVKKKRTSKVRHSPPRGLQSFGRLGEQRGRNVREHDQHLQTGVCVAG